MTVVGHGYDDNVGAPAFRNVIINGSMNVWQRNTSSTTLGYATADRWWVNNGGGTTTIAREAVIVPSKFQYAMKLTQATTANVVAIQAIESINSTHLVGQTVTISGYFAASASTSFTIDLLSSTSIDVTPSAFSTVISPSSGGSGTVSSTTYTRVSGVYVVPSSVKTLAVRINVTSLTNGTSFYFTGVQLEAGSVATPFEFEPYETTLRKCQRYFNSYGGSTVYEPVGLGFARSTTTADIITFLPVEMRIQPAVSVSAAGDFQLSNGSVAYVATSFTDYLSQNGKKVCTVGVTVASGLTNATPWRLEPQNRTTARLNFSAEL